MAMLPGFIAMFVLDDLISMRSTVICQRMDLAKTGQGKHYSCCMFIYSPCDTVYSESIPSYLVT